VLIPWRSTEACGARKQAPSQLTGGNSRPFHFRFASFLVRDVCSSQFRQVGPGKPLECSLDKVAFQMGRVIFRR